MSREQVKETIESFKEVYKGQIFDVDKAVGASFALNTMLRKLDKSFNYKAVTWGRCYVYWNDKHTLYVTFLSDDINVTYTKTPKVSYRDTVIYV